MVQEPKRERIPVSKLMVNPSNPRFEPVGDQNQAIPTMLSKEEKSIKRLAQDIVNYGLNPTKNLAVYEQNGMYVVQEGNRRVVALKLLNDPSMTHNSNLQKFFTQLKGKSDIPTQVSCVVLKTQDDAKHWIELEHTGQNQGAGVMPWDPIQKQRFLDKSSRLVKIVEYLGTDLDISKVNPTTLERLITTPYVRNKIGLTFSKGELEELESRSTILKNFKTVVTAMSKKGFSVRLLDTRDDRIKWIKQTLGHDQKKSTSTKTSSGTAREYQSSKNRKNLIPRSCKLEIQEPRINDIFLELRNNLVLDGKKSTPNAVAVLFRLFLEASLDKYIEVTNITLNKEPKIKEKINKVAKNMKDEGLANDKQLLIIRSTSSAPDTDILSIQWLHQYAHNYAIEPESNSLKARWNNLQEFFEILWSYITSKS